MELQIYFFLTSLMTKPFCFVKFVADNIVSDVKVQTEYFMEKEEITKYIPFFIYFTVQ